MASQELKELRAGAIEDFLRQLNRGFLTRHMFEHAFNAPDGTILSLKFVEAEGEFRVIQPLSPSNQTANWKSVELPGRLFTTAETYEFRDLPSAMSAVHSWLERLGQDLVVQGNEEVEVAERLRRNLNETADSLPNPGLPFSADELKEWKQRLDGVVERLKEMEEKHEIQQGRVDSLSRQLDELTKQASSVPRRIWLKNVGNKIIDTLVQSARESGRLLTDTAMRALLDHER